MTTTLKSRKENKNRISCLNCQHSYRNSDNILKCHEGMMTSVTQSYDCEEYQVFVKNKEELELAIKRAIYGVKDYD